MNLLLMLKLSSIDHEILSRLSISLCESSPRLYCVVSIKIIGFMTYEKKVSLKF